MIRRREAFRHRRAIRRPSHVRRPPPVRVCAGRVAFGGYRTSPVAAAGVRDPCGDRRSPGCVPGSSEAVRTASRQRTVEVVGRDETVAFSDSTHMLALRFRAGGSVIPSRSAHHETRSGMTFPWLQITGVPPRATMSSARLRPSSGSALYSSSDSEGSSATSTPRSAANGATVSTHRVRSADVTLSPPNACNWGTSAAAWSCPAASRGRVRSSPRCFLRLPAFACRTISDRRGVGGKQPETPEHAPVHRVRQLVECGFRCHPTQFVDFVVRDELAVGRLRCPVVHPLEFPVSGHRIGHPAEVPAEDGPKSSFFADLTDRGDDCGLPGVEFALRKRPVVVSGPVDDRDFDVATGEPSAAVATGGTPQHCTCGKDVGLHRLIGRIGHRCLRLTMRGCA